MSRQLSEQEQVRRSKLEKLTEAGVQLYPERFDMTHTLAEASQLADGVADVRVAGRIVAMRKMGKLSFVSIQDLAGRVQLCIKMDGVGEKNYEIFQHLIDIGDFIGASGSMFTTKTGEKTVQVTSYQFLGKCLNPLPEKWHGLVDVEARYRQRYVDLIMNADTRKRFLIRSLIVREMRTFLENQGFIEVETATLQSNPSGALAKPFKTHHNALDVDMYLRIAPETYLKRLIVGGFHHVFEFARCFRNEGISPQHLQEFTMVEGYSAYWNYEDNMNLIRNLFIHIIQKAFGTLVLTIGDVQVDLSKEWKRVTFRELILEHSGIDIDQFKDAKSLLKKIFDKGIVLDVDKPQELGRGNLIDHLYKKVARPKVVEPTFLTAHPIDLSPLARANDSDPNLTDRFQLIINGAEIVNAYSELVDPIEQMKRLEDQAALRGAGDEEAMVKDEDYVYSMEFGMPPISGWGIGIERMLQFLTNCENIKDCVLFPITRPKEN
ncbi:lysine--tRNA ligase [bacterium]|nr:lysine--tRNA ligase [bacterium]